MGLEGFGITHEIYERNESVFFLLINTTYQVEDDKIDPQGVWFQDLFNQIRGNSPNKDNVGTFLKQEAIKILWTAEGSESFRGFGHSQELKEVIHGLKNTKIHKDMPFTAKNFKVVRKHFEKI